MTDANKLTDVYEAEINKKRVFDSLLERFWDERDELCDAVDRAVRVNSSSSRIIVRTTIPVIAFFSQTTQKVAPYVIYDILENSKPVLRADMTASINREASMRVWDYYSEKMCKDQGRPFEEFAFSFKHPMFPYDGPLCSPLQPESLILFYGENIEVAKKHPVYESLTAILGPCIPVIIAKRAVTYSE